MLPTSHRAKPGRAVLVVMAVAVAGFGGCRSDESEPDLTYEESLEADLARTQTRQRDLLIPEGIAGARPFLALPRTGTDSRYVATTLEGPAYLRVTAAPGAATDTARTIYEADFSGRMLMVLHRENGLALGGTTVVPGPLDSQSNYYVYLLPPGGERNSATVRRTRPVTDDELAAERERIAEEARRKAADAPPVTPPITPPDNPPVRPPDR